MEGNLLHWGRGFVFVSTGEEKLRIPSKLIKITFDRGRHPEDPDCRHERNQEDLITKQVT